MKGTKDKNKKGTKGTILATQASQANAFICFVTKVVVQASVAQTTTGVGNSSFALSMPTLAPFQRKDIVLNVTLCKRKTIIHDDSVTSFETHSISTLIQNVDMVELIKTYIAKKVHNLPTLAFKISFPRFIPTPSFLSCIE